MDFILALNKKILLPDIQIVVTASQDIIQSRLKERNQLTRFEQGERTYEELFFLKEGTKILNGLGVKTIIIENSENLADNISAIAEHIKKAVEG